RRVRLLDQVLLAGHDVAQRPAADVVVVEACPRLAVAGRSPHVGHEHDVALAYEVLPARGEGPAAPRPRPPPARAYRRGRARPPEGSRGTPGWACRRARGCAPRSPWPSRDRGAWTGGCRRRRRSFRS